MSKRIVVAGSGMSVLLHDEGVVREFLDHVADVAGMGAFAPPTVHDHGVAGLAACLLRAHPPAHVLLQTMPGEHAWLFSVYAERGLNDAAVLEALRQYFAIFDVQVVNLDRSP